MRFFLVCLQDFPNDYEEFNKFVLDLDRRLSAIINQAFDDCNSLTSIFKVVNETNKFGNLIKI
jgi:hypothetical protein